MTSKWGWKRGYWITHTYDNRIETSWVAGQQAVCVCVFVWCIKLHNKEGGCAAISLIAYQYKYLPSTGLVMKTRSVPLATVKWILKSTRLTPLTRTLYGSGEFTSRFHQPSTGREILMTTTEPRSTAGMNSWLAGLLRRISGRRRTFPPVVVFVLTYKIMTKVVEIVALGFYIVKFGVATWTYWLILQQLTLAKSKLGVFAYD